MNVDTPIARFLLLLGLSFFFGLAFEEFHAHSKQPRPGGIRSFPLLALIGALLYRLDTRQLLPMSIGLLVLGIWLACFYWQRLRETDEQDAASVGLMTPICSVVAYVLGPIALAEPAWVAVGATVAPVLLLTAREKLHGLARQIETGEIVTAGKFLLLAGFILPLLPNQPVSPLTDITPYQVWMAVLAVCTVSYASYLLQRYVAPVGAGLWVALLGGLYSSTATTVVLARRARAEPTTLLQTQTGIMLATAVMYLRLLAIILVFNRSLAIALAPALLGLSAVGFVMAGVWHWLHHSRTLHAQVAHQPGNPLELGAALIFAALFVLISLASWTQSRFGTTGLYLLAAIVGVSDIDPFVLSLAEHGAGPMPTPREVVAILIAISSNNLLKAGYAAAFAGVRPSLPSAAALGALALCGLAISAGIAGIDLPG